MNSYLAYGRLNDEGVPIASSIRREEKDIDGQATSLVILKSDEFFKLIADVSLILNTDTKVE